MTSLKRHFSKGNRALVSLLVSGVAAAGLLLAERAGAEPGAVLEELGCSDCHRLGEPSPSDVTLDGYVQRKGPDLFYAGSKYRPEWLRAWLAQPAPIRPAGLYPAELTSKSERGDVLSRTPPTHPSVPAGRLDEVVAALGLLDWGAELLPADPPQRTAVPRMLAEMNFVKFKGCGSCHRIAADGPPLSGPDLYDAYTRLRTEFLTSYIANPQAWEPVAPMPGYGLEPVEVGKLVEYLRILSESSK